MTFAANTDQPSMRQSQMAGIYAGGDTLQEMFWQAVELRQRHTFMREKRLGLWHEWSWVETGHVVREVSLGLLARGLSPGDHALIVADTSVRWVISDLAILSAGCVSVGVHRAVSQPEWFQACVDNKAGIMFVQDEQQALEVQQVLPELVGLHTIIVLVEELSGASAEEGAVLSMGDLRRLGRQYDADYPEAFHQAVRSRSSRDVAAVIYTSGTSGPAKGTIHLHSGIIQCLRGYRSIFPQVAVDERICFMPLATVTERLGSEFYAVHAGTILNFVESADTVPENMREVAPSVLVAAPAFWKQTHSRTLGKIADAPPIQQKFYEWAISVGYRLIQCEMDKVRPSWRLRCQYAFARFALLDRVRHHLGVWRTKLAISTGGPLPEEVARWYGALGLRLESVWGMAEAGGFCTDAVSAGSCGPDIAGALPHNEVAIDPATQELLIRGDHLFAGYLNAAEGPKSVVDSFGWFHTGDKGEIDPVGHVRVVDRLADAVILVDGTCVLTQAIVDALTQSPYISDVVVGGDGRPHLCALILLNEETIQKYARSHDLSFSDHATLAASGDIRALIEREVDGLNLRLSPMHRVRSFHILGDRFTPADVEVSPLLKLRRRQVLDKYAHIVGSMYL